MIAVSGSIQTEIVGGSKMTFIDVAYSRFLDKTEEATVKEVVAPAKAAKAAKVVKAADAPDNNDELPC